MITLFINDHVRGKPVYLVSAGFSADAMQHTHETFTPYLNKVNVVEVKYSDKVKQMQTDICKLENKTQHEQKLYELLAQEITTELQKLNISEVSIFAKSAGASVLLLLPLTINVNRYVIQAPAPVQNIPKRNINLCLGWAESDKKVPYNVETIQHIRNSFKTVKEKKFNGDSHDFNDNFIQRHVLCL